MGFSVGNVVPLGGAPLDFAVGEGALAVAAGEAGIYMLPLR